MARHPLYQPYDGPYRVLQRKEKVFYLDINGKQVSALIDRCKPAFSLNTDGKRKKNPNTASIRGTYFNSFDLNLNLHLLVIKFASQVDIVDTGWGMCSG
ncbi:hypothetical protein AVEN_139839-1 [Araneus ventricosus]|uniref:Uncharacterized protein n=1 Tax=Araneus ventricosus TaxID=182803 RepID=A0A4Y2FXV0_ARAVE|nr:hypothetical protein AVEN_139839-1 [Araneus ventricosus]